MRPPHTSPYPAVCPLVQSCQTCQPLSKGKQVQMKLLSTIQELSWRYGQELMRVELERVALERNAPHVADACLDCEISPSGDWNYCKNSRHHLDHPYHSCLMTQE